MKLDYLGHATVRCVSQSENGTTSRPWFIASVQTKMADQLQTSNTIPRPVFNVPEQVSTFYVTRCNTCWKLFRRPVSHKFQRKVLMCNSGFTYWNTRSTGWVEVNVLESGHVSETMLHNLTDETAKDAELQKFMSGWPQTKDRTQSETRPYWNYRDEI